MDSLGLSFPRTHRLSSPLRFKAVYDARTSENRGSIVIYSLPNDLGHVRLGLSVSRRVGVAPRRNRIKRLLRESLRAMQHEIPAGYDLVIVVRPHAPLPLQDYATMLQSALTKLHATWLRRAAQKATTTPPP